MKISIKSLFQIKHSSLFLLMLSCVTLFAVYFPEDIVTPFSGLRFKFTKDLFLVLPILIIGYKFIHSKNYLILGLISIPLFFSNSVETFFLFSLMYISFLRIERSWKIIALLLLNLLVFLIFKSDLYSSFVLIFSLFLMSLEDTENSFVYSLLAVKYIIISGYTLPESILSLALLLFVVITLCVFFLSKRQVGVYMIYPIAIGLFGNGISDELLVITSLSIMSLSLFSKDDFSKVSFSIYALLSVVLFIIPFSMFTQTGQIICLIALLVMSKNLLNHSRLVYAN